MEVTNLIRFEISDETDDRLIRLLRDNPDFADVTGNAEAAPLDRILEHILATGIAHFERA